MLCGSWAALFSRWGRFNKAWSDPRGMARAPGLRPDQAETRPSLERGGWDLSPHPWDTRLSRNPERFGCSAYQSLGRYQPYFSHSEAGGTPGPKSQGQARAIRLGFFSGLNHFIGRGRNGMGPFGV